MSVRNTNGIVRTTISVILLADLLGCSRASDAPAGPVTPAAGQTDAGYSVSVIDPLPGELGSSANSVNNSGIVAGQASTTDFLGVRQRAFVTVGNATVELSPGRVSFSSIGGISNGPIVYIAGAIDTTSTKFSSGATFPVRWALSGTTSPEVKFLSAELGSANGVNDDGDVAGSAGADAHIWRSVGADILIAPPSGFTLAAARAINSSGDAIIQFSSPTDLQSFLRTVAGIMIPLPAPAGDTRPLANALSDAVSGIVYVAGTSSTTSSLRALRWRVNVATNEVTQEVLPPDTESQGVSNLGIQPVRVFSVSVQTNYPRLWRTDAIYGLELPQTSTSASPVSISKNGKYIVGHGGLRALIWTAR